MSKFNKEEWRGKLRGPTTYWPWTRTRTFQSNMEQEETVKYSGEQQLEIERELSHEQMMVEQEMRRSARLEDAQLRIYTQLVLRAMEGKKTRDVLTPNDSRDMSELEKPFADMCALMARLAMHMVSCFEMEHMDVFGSLYYENGDYRGHSRADFTPSCLDGRNAHVAPTAKGGDDER